jgi:hypothetical protein
MATQKQPLTIVIIPAPSTTAKHATPSLLSTMSPVNPYPRGNPNRNLNGNPNPQSDGNRYPKPQSAGKHTTQRQPQSAGKHTTQRQHQEGHSNNNWPPITLHVPPGHDGYTESAKPPFDLTLLQTDLFCRGLPFPDHSYFIGPNRYSLTGADKIVIQSLLGRIIETPSNPLGYVFLSELMDLLRSIVNPFYMTDVKSSTISAIMKHCFGLTVKQINYCKLCKNPCLKSNCGDHYHKSIEFGRGRATAVLGIKIVW